MPRVREGTSLVAALKLWALDVAAFMLFAKAHIATVAATMTAIPTPVKAKKVAY